MKRESDENIFDKLKRKISDFFYDLTQPIYAKLNSKKKKGVVRANIKRRKDAIFYAVFMALPVLQFLIYYVFVHEQIIVKIISNLCNEQST